MKKTTRVLLAMLIALVIACSPAKDKAEKDAGQAADAEVVDSAADAVDAADDATKTDAADAAGDATATQDN